jgi:anti-sigma regulatory factor (Ser/Thr protein kinase)
VDDLKIAVSEACATAVLGLEKSDAHDPITITFSEDGGRLELEVADRAPASDAEADPADSQGFDSRSTMSLALLQSLVDDCRITPREGGGTITRLSVTR